MIVIVGQSSYLQLSVFWSILWFDRSFLNALDLLKIVLQGFMIDVFIANVLLQN